MGSTAVPQLNPDRVSASSPSVPSSLRFDTGVVRRCGRLAIIRICRMHRVAYLA